MNELVSATKQGDIPRVRQLLRKEVDVNATDEGGATALVWAATCGNCDLVRVLLAKGARPNLQDRQKRTALFYAAVGPTVLDPKRYRTRSSKLSAVKSVAELLAKGADVSLKDEKGYTALTWALYYRNAPSLGTSFSAPARDERQQQLDTIIALIGAAGRKKPGSTH